VLVDNPSFGDDLGLYVHIRTTRVQYFSYIEQVSVRIGNHVLEFTNDVNNFAMATVSVDEETQKTYVKSKDFKKVHTPNKKWEETRFAGFLLRRDPKALSIRLDGSSGSGAHIDLIQRKNGFPAVVFDAAGTDIFEGSLGLLGSHSTGKKIARDGESEIKDPTEFALEWQVRDTDGMMFSSARFPQYPTTCSPPKKILGNRLGMSLMKEQAEKVCEHWTTDKEDCIFDVIATRDVLTASEGSVVA